MEKTVFLDQSQIVEGLNKLIIDGGLNEEQCDMLYAALVVCSNTADYKRPGFTVGFTKGNKAEKTEAG